MHKQAGIAIIDGLLITEIKPLKYLPTRYIPRLNSITIRRYSPRRAPRQ
jgi:hypothetical protein